MSSYSPSRRAFLRLSGLSKIQTTSLQDDTTPQISQANTIDSILESLNSSFELEIQDNPKSHTLDANESTQFIAKINILECMAYHHTICQVCKDICPLHISFSSSFYPEIKDSCTGCQKCIASCPTNAISLEKIQ